MVKAYFYYDDNGNYTHAGYSDEKPDNATDKEPVGIYNAVYNKSTDSWSGNSVNDYLEEQKEKQKIVVNPYQQQLSTIANQLLKQNITLSQRVAVLEKEAK